LLWQIIGRGKAVSVVLRGEGGVERGMSGEKEVPCTAVLHEEGLLG